MASLIDKEAQLLREQKELESKLASWEQEIAFQQDALSQLQSFTSMTKKRAPTMTSISYTGLFVGI